MTSSLRSISFTLWYNTQLFTIRGTVDEITKEKELFCQLLIYPGGKKEHEHLHEKYDPYIDSITIHKLKQIYDPLEKSGKPGWEASKRNEEDKAKYR